MMIMSMNMEQKKMSSNISFNLNTNDLLHQIIYLVKYKKNYDKAAIFLIENELNIDLINTQSIDLDPLEIEELLASIIKIES